MFGWAKPVPVVFGNLQQPEARHDPGGRGGPRREPRDGDVLGARSRC